MFDTEMTEGRVLALAASAVRKIDRGGRRGAMQVTTEEVTALAVIAVICTPSAVGDELTEKLETALDAQGETAE